MITPAKFPVLNSETISNHPEFMERFTCENEICQNEKEVIILYDPHRSTFEEFAHTIKVLAGRGRLTEHDLLLGTANFEQSIKQSNPDIEYYVTPGDVSGRRDWVVEFAALAQREIERGNVLGFERNLERRDLAIKIAKMILSDC